MMIGRVSGDVRRQKRKSGTTKTDPPSPYTLHTLTVSVGGEGSCDVQDFSGSLDHVQDGQYVDFLVEFEAHSRFGVTCRFLSMWPADAPVPA